MAANRRLEALRGQLGGGGAQQPSQAHEDIGRAVRDESGFDVLIIGAGFSGMLACHTLRKQGLHIRVLESGSGVGGTWYWNRYPGARCDVPSVEYSYSCFPELEEEFVWTECMAAQPEIERYANVVADKFDLRRDIDFDTTVTSMAFDEKTEKWVVTASDGVIRTAQFVITAVGCLSKPSEPALYHEALATFNGPVYLTGRWPHTPLDFSEKRVGVVGTGSSGIQAIPILAAEAAELTVFQRTPQYTIPANNHPLDKEYIRRTKENYGRIRAAERTSHAGIALVGHLGGTIHDPASELPVSNESVALLDLTPEQRAERTQRLGFEAVRNLSDTRWDMEANRLACDMFREAVYRVVKDPVVAEALVPTNTPLGCKRQVIDTNYYETFNRPNVKLVDLRKGKIERITKTGLSIAGQPHFDLDVLVFATGFDALTGPLLALNPTGRHGQTLKEKWAAGPKTYLGLQTAGFPNMFTITGPGSPSVLSNMIVSIEQHVEWISQCIKHTRESGHTVVEATQDAEEAWVTEVNEVSKSGIGGMIIAHPSCASWYLGANIPGKPRVFMPYAGGLGKYRGICEEVVKDGYRGFVFK